MKATETRYYRADSGLFCVEQPKRREWIGWFKGNDAEMYIAPTLSELLGDAEIPIGTPFINRFDDGTTNRKERELSVS